MRYHIKETHTFQNGKHDVIVSAVITNANLITMHLRFDSETIKHNARPARHIVVGWTINSALKSIRPRPEYRARNAVATFLNTQIRRCVIVICNENDRVIVRQRKYINPRRFRCVDPFVERMITTRRCGRCFNKAPDKRRRNDRAWLHKYNVSLGIKRGACQRALTAMLPFIS